MSAQQGAYCLVLTQHGEGCDYTIGCGTKVVRLGATTLDEAKAVVLAMFTERGDGMGEPEYKFWERNSDEGTHAIKSAWIAMDMGFALTKSRVNEALQPSREREEKERLAQEEAAERAILAKLKQKYGA